MTTSIENRYKDQTPDSTIQLTRSVLGSHGIIAAEIWNNVGDRVYSVHLSVLNTTITANGKGSNKEYALASAYGEMVERLSLLLPFYIW